MLATGQCAWFKNILTLLCTLIILQLMQTAFLDNLLPFQHIVLYSISLQRLNTSCFYGLHVCM